MEKKSIPFVGLHSHTVCGSPFDAFGYPQDHIDAAVKKGMSAIAITDHGNCNGVPYQVMHIKKLLKEGVKFKSIIGVESYFVPSIESWRKEYELNKEKNKDKRSLKDVDMDGEFVPEDEGSYKKETKSKIKEKSHIVLLAQNQTGLNNLFKIVSESSRKENFYRYPRVDYKILKKYNEGIISLSACIGGIYGSCYWRHSEKGIDFVTESMREITEGILDVFGDRWYGELQWNRIPEQHIINQLVIQLSKE
jgi:DNA polymerase-3 subunit alpha